MWKARLPAVVALLALSVSLAHAQGARSSTDQGISGFGDEAVAARLGSFWRESSRVVNSQGISHTAPPHPRTRNIIRQP